MKISHYLTYALFGIIFIFSGCRTDHAGLDVPYADSHDIATIVNFFTEIRDDLLIKEVDPTKGDHGYPQVGVGECPVVTYKEPKGTYPNTMTLDFKDHCKCRPNDLRTGFVIVEQSGPMDTPGSSWLIHFDHFSINDVEFDASIELTVKTMSNGIEVFTSETHEGEVHWPDGSVFTLEMEEEMTLIKGGNTPEILEDDVFEITGKGTGISMTKTPFILEVVDPLVRTHGCVYIRQGKLHVTEGDEHLELDFGKNSCDKKVGVETNHDGAWKVEMEFDMKR